VISSEGSFARNKYKEAGLRAVIRSSLFVFGLTMALLSGCGADDPIPWGKYQGENVNFSVEGADKVTDITLMGMQCRVPFPDFEELSICKHNAPGLLVGPFSVRDGEFKVTTDEVSLTGAFSEDGKKASGTWSFKRTCLEGSVCSAQGTWESEFAHADPPEPDIVVPDTVDPEDVGPSPDGTVANFDGSIPEPPVGALPHQTAANAYLNMIRGSVGVDLALEDAYLNEAAQLHAEYVAFHADKYNQSGLSPHQQNDEWDEGFTGVSVSDRCAAAGYGGGWLWEVMTWVSSPEGSIDGWMETLYHRVPLIHPNTAEFGYGMTTEGSPCDVMDGSYGEATLPGPARWPLPEAKGVNSGWNGYESPQPPLPETESYPSGPIITITFKREVSKELLEATLEDPTGAVVPSQVQSPQNDSWLKDTWCIYAYSPLKSQTEYTVTFKGKVSGQPYEDSWSFTTQ
jgi:hypothetical protein